jgi:circadian clock protein KaiC
MKRRSNNNHSPALAKCATGIHGLDEITQGGLPRGRPTLVCGAAGSGKTLLAMEFVVRGARDFGEPGVFVAFEETERELTENLASLGFNLPALLRRKQLMVEHVWVERSEIEETGEYDLEGLFVRLDLAIRTVGAKRVALDGFEALFAALPNEAILRAELRRLFRWLKDRGLTAVITGEQGSTTLSRHGLEEYVSDCVIVLDHRVVNQVGTRRLRIVKYRGSAHGTNEYPTLIDAGGLSVLPVTSLGLDYRVNTERISSGVPTLDAMLGGRGFYRASSVLISGTPGTGKSSLAAAFVDAACRRGERCLYLAFEESAGQIMRNMNSIGIDLARWVRPQRLHFHAVRSVSHGLEQHLLAIYNLVNEIRPTAVVLDPVTNLDLIGDELEVTAMLTRVIDFLKMQNVTALFTGLTQLTEGIGPSEGCISSLMDTWVQLRTMEAHGGRKRVLCILKSRGMAHSMGVRELALSKRGIHLLAIGENEEKKRHDHELETQTQKGTLGPSALRRRPDRAIPARARYAEKTL